MKKLILIVSVIFSIFTSCTRDDNKTEDTTNQYVLVTKWTETFANGNVYTATYSYDNGNQINQIKYDVDNSYSKYTYTNNLITKIEQFRSDNSLSSVTTLEYDNLNRLIKEITIEDRDFETLTFTSNYTHNGDKNTITEQYEDRSNINNEINTAEKIYYIKDNEIFKTVYPFNNYITEFSYKADHNPFKNILGFDKIYFSFYFGEKGNQKNIDTKISPEATEYNTYNSYNTQGYPTEIIQKYTKYKTNSTKKIKIEYTL
jgi:hypothetical protein